MSTLSHVAQLISVPDEVRNLQLSINCKIMKVPFRGLGAAIHGLREEVGIRVPVKVQDWGLAAMVRTAMRTIAPCWQDAAFYLRAADDEFRSIADVFNLQWGPRHWKMKPFAQALS